MSEKLTILANMLVLDPKDPKIIEDIYTEAIRSNLLNINYILQANEVLSNAVLKSLLIKNLNYRLLIAELYSLVWSLRTNNKEKASQVKYVHNIDQKYIESSLLKSHGNKIVVHLGVNIVKLLTVEDYEIIRSGILKEINTVVTNSINGNVPHLDILLEQILSGADKKQAINEWLRTNFIYKNWKGYSPYIEKRVKEIIKNKLKVARKNNVTQSLESSTPS
jgi:hypothetical protein